MRLTQFTDFGLRALMRLAADTHRSFSTGDIATEFGISRHHLTKVIRDLADASPDSRTYAAIAETLRIVGDDRGAVYWSARARSSS